jgi:SAM-dependent methyltransferase
VNNSLIANESEAPPEWKLSGWERDSRLHQLAPYIGKLKPVIARELLLSYTKPGDLVLDCFSGSGTIPLEAVLLGRRVLAFDTNPYAITLTRAKLEAPKSLARAIKALDQRIADSLRRPKYGVDSIPIWVRKFFHPNTLQDALRFADECIDRDDQFLLACLLGILHHQRPGFLSYPSSHLVPYLRDRKFPREDYPQMYEERSLAPRLLAKVQRALKDMQPPSRKTEFRITQTAIGDVKIRKTVDAIITSPPYMNALDYVRDNRLRMWFLDRNTENYSPEATDRKEQFDALTLAFSQNALSRLRVGGHCVLVVGETVTRRRTMSHPAERIIAQLLASDVSLEVVEVINDEIPDIRRSRRSGGATKRELIVVLKKKG